MNPGNYQPSSSSAVDAMLATDYGATAETVAQQQGVSVESVAAVGQAESGFRNVPTANGSSSATGHGSSPPRPFCRSLNSTVSDTLRRTSRTRRTKLSHRLTSCTTMRR